MPRRGERRYEGRHHLVFRIGKIVDGKKEMLCVIRDDSASGISLKTFGEVELPDAPSIELANGRAIPVTKVWQQGTFSGFRFKQAISVDAFLNPQPKKKKRGLRLCVDEAIMVTDDEGMTYGRLLDISVQGAKFTLPERELVGSDVRLMIPDLDLCRAQVRWSKDGAIGVTFYEDISFNLLASWSARRFVGPQGR